ncbi:cold shock domain-containing protein [uncultured Bifidobacterium sp.]|uniref:cold-shock protein n=1 Tax=uncultured Bifidobacterium sp. TaxID=165187 RepID=UPI0028DC47EF|nr:cold shock domain-containing protein [uncultured Bifidobacterium sp.]
MPTGRVRWYDASKGYGFIADESGHDVFLPAAALADASASPRKGVRVEFSVVDGRRGPQAMDVHVMAAVPSIVRATRPRPDDMVAIVEDLITMLDSAGNGLRRHHYPSSSESRKLAALLRAVADDFDVQD